MSHQNGCTQDKCQNYLSVEVCHKNPKAEHGNSGTSRMPEKFNLMLACRPDEYNRDLPDFGPMESLIEDFKKVCKEEIGITGDMSYYVEIMRHSINMVSYYSHNIPITDDRIKSFSYLLLPLAIYDDEIDQVSQQHPTTVYKNVLAFNKIFIETLRGNGKSYIGRCPFEISMFTKGFEILRLAEKSYQISKSVIENYDQKCDKLLKGLSDHLDGHAFTILESTSPNHTIDTYIFRRERSVGMYPTWEYARLIHGIELTDEIRNSLVLQQIIRCSVIATALLNDLFSWEREKDGVVGQNYLSLNIKGDDRDLFDIATELIQKINDTVAEMLRLSDLIEKNHGDEEGLSKFLLMLKRGVDGNTWLHLLTPRYCKGVNYIVS